MLEVVEEGMGKSLKVRMKGSEEILLMKVFSKSSILERGEVEHTRAEKSVLGKKPSLFDQLPKFWIWPSFLILFFFVTMFEIRLLVLTKSESP